MEEGTRTKKTIFIGGLDDSVDQETLINSFSTFGDIIDVQIPPAPTNNRDPPEAAVKHRGFAFVTFSTQIDAQDAIDNMDLNELGGRVIRVNLARPQKGALATTTYGRAIWESEEWLQQYAKPVGPAGVGSLNPGNIERKDDEDQENNADEPMEE